jgi:hypothetical protein
LRGIWTMTKLTVIYTQIVSQIAHHRIAINTKVMNKILIIVISILLSSCIVEGEVYPWYDTEGNSGVTNEIKL